MFQSKTDLKVVGALVLLVIIHGDWGFVDAENVFTLGTLEFPFKCNEQGTLWCEGDASTAPDGALYLAPGSRAAYANPLDILDEKRRWLSFSTYFRFSMEYGKSPRPGDGMAFLILSAQRRGSSDRHSSSIRSGAGDLMAHEIAVRLKSFMHNNLGDRRSNQVGVSRGGVDTDATRNANELGIELAGGTCVHVWIDFHAVEILEIRISLDQSKPRRPFISYPVNRSEFLVESSVISVGFSGSNDYYLIHYWRSDTFSDSEDFPDIDFPVVFTALICLYCLLIAICSRGNCQIADPLESPSISSRSSSTLHSEAENTSGSESSQEGS